MLRGIHKATSNWLGQSIMAGVMGGLVVSFAIWGIGDIFRGFGRNSAKIGDTEISIEQFRQYYTDRLQQFGRKSAARSRRIRRAHRASTKCDRTDGRRDDARRTSQRLAARHHRCRHRRPHHQRSELPRHHRQIRPRSFRADHPPSRLYRTEICRGAASRDLAPPNRAQHQRRIAGAGNGEKRSTDIKTKNAASNTSASVRRRQATSQRQRPKSSANISTSARFCFARRNTAR